MVPNDELYILTVHFELPKRGQPLYKGQDVWSQLSFMWRFHSTCTLVTCTFTCKQI